VGHGGSLTAVALAPKLLDILACPEDKGPLLYGMDGEAEVLLNPRLSRVYDVRDGIPVLLIDEARAVDAAEVTRLQGLGLKPTFSA
jgi:uncharacterized protein